MSTHKLENMYCKMIVVAGKVPVLVAVEEQNRNTNEVLEQYVGMVGACFNTLPETVQEQIAGEFLSMDSLGDPGHGTIVVKNGWGDPEYEFNNRTITIHTGNYRLDPQQGVYEGFAAMVLSEVRYLLNEGELASAWRNSDNPTDRNRPMLSAQRIAEELEGFLHEVTCDRTTGGAMTTDPADSTPGTPTARPVFTGENAFEDHGIEVYVEFHEVYVGHRDRRPYVALHIQGETTWLCKEEARFIADHLPEKLRRAAADVERLHS